jgi:hypothetical protein
MQTPTTTRHGPTCLANVCFTQCGTRGDEAVELAFPRGSCTWVFECAVGRAYAIKNSPSDAYDTERWVRAAAGPTYATHVDSVVPKTTLLLVPIPGRVADRLGDEAVQQLHDGPEGRHTRPHHADAVADAAASAAVPQRLPRRAQAEGGKGIADRRAVSSSGGIIRV